MPAFTVSSVDTTANTLTSTGVAATGQPEGAVVLTGDRLRVRNVGGALPAPLAATTDYYCVRQTDDVIKLSDTNAHALAGTNIIDLTTTGSGTTTIEFGLPYALPTAIAGPGVQARSSIFNAMYNALVALYCLLTGQAETVWNGAITLLGTLFAADIKHGSQTETICATAGTALESKWVNDASGGLFKQSVGNGLLTVSIPLKVGDRVTGLTFMLLGDGVADVTATVEYIDSTMAAVQVGTLTVNNQAASWSSKTVTIASPHKMLAGESAHVIFLASAAGLQLGNINYVKDRPLP